MQSLWSSISRVDNTRLSLCTGVIPQKSLAEIQKHLVDKKVEDERKRKHATTLLPASKNNSNRDFQKFAVHFATLP